MRWQTRRLAELLADAKSGFACGEDPPDGVFQFRMNNVTAEGTLDLSKKRRVPRATRNLDTFLIEPGDVLFNATNSPELVGKSAFFLGHHEPSVFSNHFLRLRPHAGQLDGRFLARWLTLQFQRRVFEGMCHQWVNQATVGRDSLLALEIPVPPLAEQRRIAEVLDRAEALRAKRRAALAQLDTLTQAIFIDLFGDPITNPKGWKKCSVGDVTDCIVPGRDKPKSFSGDIPWITTDDLSHLGCTFSSPKGFGLNIAEINEVRARVIPSGSIIISCVGDLGITSIAGQDMVVNQQLHSFQCQQEVNNIFLMQCLVFQKAFMYAKASSTTLPYMNKSVCNSIPVFVPPMDIQNEFARRVAVVKKLKAAHRASLADMDALFAALQHRAFRGEL